jgi:hypothetical protein
VPRVASSPKCIFDENRADSHEHAIPKWIAKRFGLRGVFLTQLATNLPPAKQPLSVASFRRRIFCADCNRHFKHLEDAVIPILEPMGLGESFTLSRDDQQTLALWGMKTTLAILAASKIELGNFVPESHFARIRFEGLPPDDAWVGYCAWDGPTALWVGTLPWINEEVDPPPVSDAYQVILCIGEVAMKVVGFREPVRPPGRPGGHSLSLVSVWPKAEQVNALSWPPLGGIPFTMPTFDTLFSIVPITYP